MKILPKAFLYLGGIIGFILLVMFLLTMRIDPHWRTDWTVFANFGEAATVVAAIWALAAVLLAYQTLDAQRTEFKTASQRFSDEQKQNITTYRQTSFQNSFFILLNRQREIVNAFRGYQISQEGQQQLIEIYKAYKIKYQNRRATHSSEQKIESCKASGMETQKTYPEIGHYARSLYHLVKYVDAFAEESSKRREEFDSKQFIDFIQAQMSKWELFLILVNSFNHDKMLELIKKHNLVENLNCNPSVVEESDAKEVAVSLGVKIKD